MRVLRADDRLWMVRVDKGEEIVTALLEFAAQHDVRCASVTGLGGVRDVTLAYFDVDVKQYLDRTIHGVLELVSLVGNLAIENGKPFLHAHVVLPDREFHCFGGHLRSAPVAVTAEFAVRCGDATLERRFNADLGIREQCMLGPGGAP